MDAPPDIDESVWSGRVTRSRRVSGPTGEPYLAKGLKNDLQTPAAQSGFVAAARALEGWRLPGVAAVHLVQERPARMLCEYIPGHSFQALSRRAWAAGPGVPIPVGIAVAQSVLRILTSALEDRGLHHGAMSAREVIITFEGQVAATDFGLVAQIIQSGAIVDRLKIAPEIAPDRAADERSDVFGVGALLYESLVSPGPVDGLQTPIPRAFKEDAPAVARLIETAIQIEPSDRQSSLGELQVSLQEAARLDGFVATPDSIRMFAQNYWPEDAKDAEAVAEEPPPEATRVSDFEMPEATEEALMAGLAEEDDGHDVTSLDEDPISRETQQAEAAPLEPSEMSEADLELPTRQEDLPEHDVDGLESVTSPSMAGLRVELPERSTDAAAGVYEDEDPTGGDPSEFGALDDELAPIDQLPPPASDEVWAVEGTSESIQAARSDTSADPVAHPSRRPPTPPPISSPVRSYTATNAELEPPEWMEATGARRPDSRAWMNQPLADQEAGPTNRSLAPLAPPNPNLPRPNTDPAPGAVLNPVPKAPQRALPTAHIRKRHTTTPETLLPQDPPPQLVAGVPVAPPPSESQMNVVSWLLAALVVILSGLVIALLFERSALIERIETGSVPAVVEVPAP